MEKKHARTTNPDAQSQTMVVWISIGLIMVMTVLILSMGWRQKKAGEDKVVLGDVTTSSDEETEKSVREEIDFWEGIVKIQPGYLESYLRLAVKNWQLYQDDKAVEYLDKARGIDPNNAEVKKIEEMILKSS